LQYPVCELHILHKRAAVYHLVSLLREIVPRLFNQTIFKLLDWINSLCANFAVA
jgi:hypothetical protein